MKDRYEAQRKLFLDTLGGKCAKCGLTDELQIDHRDPANKSFNVGRLWGESRIHLAFAELKKCQALCGNHHREKSAVENTKRLMEKYRQINGPDGFRHGTLYGWLKKKCQCDPCMKSKRAWHDKRNAKRRMGIGYGPRF